MKSIKSFLFANVPLSVLHFIIFVIFGGFLGEPGYHLAGLLGASGGSILWWLMMILNSLIWGGVITLVIIPFFRKLFK